MGGGSVFEDYQQSAMIPFPRDWLRPIMEGSFADLFVARGDGDSMVPTLLDGDLVIVILRRNGSSSRIGYGACPMAIGA